MFKAAQGTTVVLTTFIHFTRRKMTMKRLVALAIVAAFVFGSLGSAQAVDVKAAMTWELGFGWEDNTTFTDAKQGGHVDAFRAVQIISPQFTFISSETLQAVLAFEIGTTYFGNNVEDQSGGGIDADIATPTITAAFLDWSPAEKLQLRMGVQPVGLPSAAFGNPVLDTDVAGIVANYAFTENVGVTAFWLRPFDRYFSTDDQTGGQNSKDEMDMFGFTVPLTFEGVSLTPWAMYARNGNDSDYWNFRYGGEYGDPGNDFRYEGSSNLWWVGAALELSLLDPISIKIDAMYGASSSTKSAPEYAGWLVAGLFEYKTESAFGTPGLLAWYASGDGKNDEAKNGGNGDFGRMPIVGTSACGFAPLSYGFSRPDDSMSEGLISSSGVGTWGIGLQLDGMTFVDKLSHALRLAYIQGTNDKRSVDASGFTNSIDRVEYHKLTMGEGVYLTEKDHAIEFDFVTSYEVHDNLTIFLEANYIYLDLDKKVWGDAYKTTDAWRAFVKFQYEF